MIANELFLSGIFQFLCVLLIAVSITSGLPADDVPQKDLKIQQSVPSPAAQVRFTFYI